MELIVSPPAFASPMMLAPDAFACSRNEEKSVPGTDLAEHRSRYAGSGQRLPTTEGLSWMISLTASATDEVGTSAMASTLLTSNHWRAMLPENAIN
jgi:hypothetical protein